MKNQFISRIVFLLTLLMCEILISYAEERPSVTARLEQKYESVTFVNENGVEYYKLRNTRPGTYDSYYGIADVSGKIIIPCQYNYVSLQTYVDSNFKGYASETYFWILETSNEMYGVADKKGKIIIPCKYGYPFLSDYGSIGGKMNGELYGFAFIMGGKAAFTEKGKELIPEKRGYTNIFPCINPYDEIKFFSVAKGEKKGLCDANGTELLPPIYNRVFNMSDFSPYELRYFMIETDKGIGLYDYKKRRIALSPKYYMVRSWGNIYSFQVEKNGVYKVYYEDKFLTTAEKLQSNTIFDNANKEDKYCIFKKGKKQGVINEVTGNLLPLEVDSIMQIKDGTVSVLDNELVTIYSLTALEKGELERIASMSNKDAAKAIVSDADTNIPKVKKQDENTFAVIIANENYNDFIVPAANNDGKIFKEYCIHALGIPLENILYYEDATVNNIYSAVKRLKDLAEVYDEGCKVIFYYSGQGVTDERTKEMYLLPTDGTLKSISSTCYSISKLYGEIGKLTNIEQALFLIDAPFNGMTKENKPLVQARGVAIKSAPNKVTGNAIAIEAATEGQTAHVYPLQNHGLFTYYLLKAMQSNTDNKTLLDMMPDVIKNVKDKSTRDLKVPQIVQIKSAKP